MIADEQLAEAVHDTLVRRLQHAYADVVNRRAWPELEQLFVTDAPVIVDRRVGEPLHLVGGSAVGDFIAGALARFEFFEFVILNAHIAFPRGPQAGEASSRLFMCEVRQHRDSARMTTAFGLYHDRYRLDGDRWRFAERRYHSLARSGRDLEAFPFPRDPGIDVPGVPT
ncbi:MAG TPA: nuclear transport factor 2 family protein [Acidimicrobiales bacterium]|nr:nuclear transport factor 2 family protein [Acidimicrobiales bacterium]